MRKHLVFMIVLALALCAILPSNVLAATELLESKYSIMDDISPWSAPYGGKIEQASENGNKYLRYTGIKHTWSTPLTEVFKYIGADAKKCDGATYLISFAVAIETSDGSETSISVMMRTNKQNTVLFPEGNETDARGTMMRLNKLKSGAWYAASFKLSVTADDVVGEQVWKFCLDGFRSNEEPTQVTKVITAVDLDDFYIERISEAPEQSEIFGGSVKSLNKNVDGTQQSENASVVASYDFEDGKVPAICSKLSCGALTIGDGLEGKGLWCTDFPQRWSSPQFNIRQLIKKAGTYTVVFDLVIIASSEETGSISFLIRGSEVNSFIQQYGTNYFCTVASDTYKLSSWKQYKAEITVTEDDIKLNGAWNFCIDRLPDNTEKICFDNFQIFEGTADTIKSSDTDDTAIDANNANTDISEDAPLKKIEREEDVQEPFFDKSIVSTAKEAIILTVILMAVSIIISIEAKNIKRAFRYIFKRR